MNSEDWSEFEWEREIRNDEERIHSYMNELPGFIDLPDEEDMILKRMELQPELSPHPDDSPVASFFDQDPDDNQFFPDDWQKRDGADAFIQAQKLALQWSVIFASELDEENMADGLRINCVYGKIMARLGDVLDIDQEGPPGLKIAVSKRICAEINALLGELDAIALKQPGLQGRISTHKAQLHKIRESVIDIINRTRGQTD
jgi:hypothetical protein